MAIATMAIKNAAKADEVRTMPKTKVEVVNLSGYTLMRATFQPGWKWTECVKSTAKTDTCEVAHVNYIVSGRIMVAMDDGSKKELGPGDFAVIPPGHDAWVVGSEPCVAIDFIAGKKYGKK